MNASIEMYMGKELEGYHEGNFFFLHSSAVVPRPKFVGTLWTGTPWLIPWHFAAFYLLLSIGVGIS